VFCCLGGEGGLVSWFVLFVVVRERMVHT
jgi:hypothetical protein